MEENAVPWPFPNSPAQIESLDGVDEILKPGVVEAYLNTTVEALGIVVDANGDASARWDQIRAICDGEFVDLPQQRFPPKACRSPGPVALGLASGSCQIIGTRDAGRLARPTHSERFQGSLPH